MSYATSTDVLDRYPGTLVADITDTGTKALARGEAETEGARAEREAERTRRLEVAVSDASAEVDGYIGRVCRLPLLAPPPVLKRIAIDIAVYRLMSWLPKESVEDARRRFEDAIRWLEAVAAGDIQLEGAPNAASGNVAWYAPTRKLDDNGLKGFL